MEKLTLQPNNADAGKRIDAWLSAVLENTTRSAAQRLLEEGDYSREGKAYTRSAAPFSGIYFGLVTAGFLAWGFIGNAWDRAWIIWPIASVAFGAVYGIVRALRRKDG